MLQGNKASVAEGQLLKITKAYGTTGFMYTQYPHKRFWKTGVTDKLFKESLIERYSSDSHPSILYVHIPYCEQLCWFCTCHVSITQSYKKVRKYLHRLDKEINHLVEFCKSNNLKLNIREIHLGGGSPTYVNEEDFIVLVEKLNQLAPISGLEEFAIEIDPRGVDRSRMHFYADQGINRISFGVQDFDLKVQKAINRVQPSYLISNLLPPDIRSKFKNGISFDMLVGLPHQTIETMTETCKIIMELDPDRVCMNYIHYSPEFVKHQTLMCDGKNGRPSSLPDFLERKNIFIAALNTLTGGGYVRTGYDHFAKPDDANAIALASGTMGWNELGATPGRARDCIGIGISSISTIGNRYFKSYYELVDWGKAIENYLFPIYSEHALVFDEIVRREVILSLRIFFKVDYSTIEEEFSIKFSEYFANEIRELKSLEDDGLVTVRDDRIVVTEFGYQFSNIVCRIFDLHYQGTADSADTGERFEVMKID